MAYYNSIPYSAPSTTVFDWVHAEARSSIHDPVGALSQPNEYTDQHIPGPTRTEQVPVGRFRPYEMPCARANEHRTGPSTLVSTLVLYIGPPTSQPPGWVPKTTADAEKNQTITEEQEAPVSNLYRSHILHAIEWSFGVRCQSKPESNTGRENLAHPT